MGKFIAYSTHASQYDGPFDSVVGWSAAGMGDVIVTENGHLIAVDGGCPEDAEDFLALLEKEANGEKPTVDLWIVTHPHGDHYGALEVISKSEEMRNRVNVKTFCFYFPEEFEHRNGTRPCPKYNDRLNGIAKTFGAEVRTPTLGETVDVDGTEIKFLYVPYDCRILNRVANENMISLIFTVTGKEKRVMVTGDAYGRSMQVTAWLYHKALKCDIFQMPHHGLCDAHCIDFYKEVNAETVLIPISVAGYRTMHSDMYPGKGRDANLWVEENAEEVHKMFDGTVTLTI